jgi:hypothetical protein
MTAPSPLSREPTKKETFTRVGGHYPWSENGQGLPHRGNEVIR